jgi:hypothetical protein
VADDRTVWVADGSAPGRSSMKSDQPQWYLNPWSYLTIQKGTRLKLTTRPIHRAKKCWRLKAQSKHIPNKRRLECEVGASIAGRIANKNDRTGSKVSDSDSQADGDPRFLLLPISIGQRCFFVLMILARIVTPYPAQSGDLVLDEQAMGASVRLTPGTAIAPACRNSISQRFGPTVACAYPAHCRAAWLRR